MTVIVGGDDRVAELPPGWDPLTGYRSECYRWDLLDGDDKMIGDLDSVSDGSLDFNLFDETRGKGSFTWSGRKSNMPDWDNVRVRPVYTARLGGGAKVEWPLGVFLTATPELQYTGRSVKAPVALYDKTLILRQAIYSITKGYPAGGVVTDLILDRLRSYTGRGGIEDSEETLKSGVVWPPGTTVLQTLNELLEGINYFGLFADNQGVIRSSAYRPPADRPVLWHFKDGENCIYKDGFTQVRDTFDVPNRVIAISQGDGETPGLVSRVELDEIAPGHPLSIEKRGRRINRVEENVEATSQASLDAFAYRLIRESVQTASKITFEHAPLDLPLNGHVRFTYQDQVDIDAVIENVAKTCTTGTTWTTTLREVLV